MDQFRRPASRPPLGRGPRPVRQAPASPRPQPVQVAPSSGQAGRFPRKWLWVGIVVVVVLAVAGAGMAFWDGSGAPAHTAEAPRTETTTTEAEKVDDTTIRLLATGDFIAHDSVNSAAKQGDGSYDYLPLMADFADIFRQADIRFCNDPILNGGAQFGITGYPVFNSPTEFVTDMGKLGCNLVNTASNHSFDKTQAEISASVAAWESVPNMLAVAGQNSSQAAHDRVSYFTVKGVKFAFVAYTTYTNRPLANNYGVTFFSQDLAKQQIGEAKQNGAEIIIASMRWGTEYSPNVNAMQKQNAQFLADQGVSLILGHGPHVLQSAQELTGSGGNKTVVWYSLGNFLNTQIPPETLFNGLATVDFDSKTKQITKLQYVPIYMHYEWTAAQAKAENLSARKNLHLYFLEDATDAMLQSNALSTTVEAQKQRISGTLSQNGLTIPLISKHDYR